MNERNYLTGARIVLADEVIEDGSLLIEDGVIRAINPICPDHVKETSLSGQTLIPGIVDLHSDALEKEVEPRPGVFFPLELAVSQVDRRNAQAGVTSAFHAISFAHKELGIRNITMAEQLVKAIKAAKNNSLVHNHVHCRYEITDSSSLEVLERLLSDNQCDLLSFMDHTPGQGQFKTLSDYRTYLMNSYGGSEAQVEELLNNKQLEAKTATERIQQLSLRARECGLPMASHDDDDQDKVSTMHGLGVSISEFPINLQAAKQARKLGMWTVFGAPNLLRGESQSGSIKAREAIDAGVANCICSDYHPGTLLPAILKLEAESDLSLNEAVKLITLNPALAAKLQGRGEIKPGYYADLAAFDSGDTLPKITQVWKQGLLTYQARWRHAA